MNARRIIVLGVAAITLAASGGYVFVYLYRWEWNRALISGLIFVAAEVALVGWALNNKLTELRRDLDSDRARSIAAHLDVARAERSTVFDWLRRSDSGLGVFVPILMGAGLLLSAAAWVVERLGRSTAGRLSDRRLATSLARLSPPPGGFLDDRADPLRDLRGPSGGRW